VIVQRAGELLRTRKIDPARASQAEWLDALKEAASQLSRGEALKETRASLRDQVIAEAVEEGKMLAIHAEVSPLRRSLRELALERLERRLASDAEFLRYRLTTNVLWSRRRTTDLSLGLTASTALKGRARYLRGRKPRRRTTIASGWSACPS